MEAGATGATGAPGASAPRTARTFARIAREAPFHDEGYGFDVFGLHPPSLARAVRASRFFYERYFRVDSAGAEHIPAAGPVILVANHGGVLPVDGAMLCLDVLRQTEPPRIPRAVADHFVPRLPLVSTLVARMGVVAGTRANVRHLLGRGELIVIFPEGVTGPGKPFRERYQIQDWRVGFAELAIRYGAAIVPVAIIGAEESWPMLHKVTALRAFGTPYLPILASPVPLPVRFHLRYGAPIRLAAEPAAADDPRAVAAAAAEARAALEQLIAQARAARERGLGGLFR
ncbi:MAG TPA: lysophospholipid acyltransferase family protein [Kofleriaceae bacterium]|nr:lysophospholipid acyltransferase family protein [Kofleriaceae bacterium]